MTCLSSLKSNMKPQRDSLLNGSALVFAATTALFGSNAAAQNAPPPAPAPAASAGAVNDWLRKSDDLWKDWDLGGQVRVRLEAHDFYGVAGRAGALDFRDHGGIAHNNFMMLREKVHVGYSIPWFGFYVEGRDSSTSGDERDPNPEADSADLHQAYLTIGNKQIVSLKVGRQELSYGDERLIGAFDWNNLGRVFDGAKLRYEDKNLWVDAFVSRVVLVDEHSFNMANEYETFSGLYASTKLVPKQETQLYFLARNTETESPFAHVKDTPQAGGASPRDIYTPGLRVKSLPGQLDGWDYSTELMYQFGRYQNPAASVAAQRAARSQSHEAFAAYVGAGYTFEKVTARPRLGVEYNYGSGDSNPKDNKHGTFDNLFPTNHKFYGMMDFISLQNIHNVRLMSSVQPHKKLTISLEGHLFWLADTQDSFYTVAGGRRGGTAATPGTGYGINKGYDSFVGSEIDLVATYKICPSAAVQVGYGHFFTGDYIDQSLSSKAFGSHDADFLYLQTTFTF
jgi:hypothetical protein